MKCASMECPMDSGEYVLCEYHRSVASLGEKITVSGARLSGRGITKGVEMTRQIEMVPQPELIGDIWHWQNTAWTDGIPIQTTQMTPHDYCPYGSPEQTVIDQRDGIWYWFVDVSDESLLEQVVTLKHQRDMLLAAIFGFDELIAVRSYPELIQQAIQQLKTGNRPPMEGI